MGAAALEGTLSLTAEASLEGAAGLAGAGAFALLLDLPLFLFTLLSSCCGSTSLLTMLALVFCTLTRLPGGLL